MQIRSLSVPLVAGLLGVALSAPLAAQDFTYERQGDTLVRLEGGTRFVVDPTVVSARFAPGVNDYSDLLEQLGGDPGVLAELSVVRSNRLGIFDLSVPQGADVLDVVARLRATGLVDFAEENTIGVYLGGIPNDPMWGSLWHLENTGQSGGMVGADVSALEAWGIEDGDPSVIVAVLDSGSDYTHPDLAANMWTNPGEIPSNGIDDDANGYIDDVIGWDFNGSGDNDPQGSFTHGTWVAGTVAAVGNNGIGVVGLAGGGSDGAGVSVLNCNVGAFSPLASILDDAILYAADHGARVITMSLTVGASAAIDAAADYAWNTAGVYVDCATGNNGFSVGYPASDPTSWAWVRRTASTTSPASAARGPSASTSRPAKTSS